MQSTSQTCLWNMESSNTKIIHICEVSGLGAAGGKDMIFMMHQGRHDQVCRAVRRARITQIVHMAKRMAKHTAKYTAKDVVITGWREEGGEHGWKRTRRS